MILTITPEDDAGGGPISATFPRRGLLFLVPDQSAAGRGGGLALISGPAQGGLVYAIFSISSGNISCACLRAEVIVDDKLSAAFKNGSRMQLGRRSFRISIEGRSNAFAKWAMRRRKVIGGAALAVALMAAICMVHNQVVSRIGRAHVDVAEGEAPVAQEKNAGDGDLIAEAKAHLRSGRIQQARMALAEAMDSHPDDQDARALYESIDEEFKANGGSADSSELESRAGRLFDEGTRLMRAGDLAAARNRFLEAKSLLRSSPSQPTFARALDDALGFVREESLRIFAPTIARLARLLDSAHGMDARATFLSLAEAFSDARAAADALPEDEGARTMLQRMSEGLAAAGDRWIASAQAVERLDGCSKALPIYSEIAAAMRRAGDGRADDIAGDIVRCGGRSKGNR